MNIKQNPILREDTESAKFEYNMRILKENAETVTITLRHYEELKEIIDVLKKQNNVLSNELLNELKNNSNYELKNNSNYELKNNSNYVLQDNVYSFFIGTSRYCIKKGINEQIDSLQYEIELLKRKLNIKLTFWEKLKNLFKD